MNKPIALITGATSGIGEATARVLAASHRLILCGRRTELLNNLQEELQGDTDVTTLSFDIRERIEAEQALDSLDSHWQNIEVLINNAGNAHGLDFIQEGSVEDWEAMLDINVKGLLYVSKKILPGMIARKKGHVVNIGSIAGKEVYPKRQCVLRFQVRRGCHHPGHALGLESLWHPRDGN